MKYLAVFAFCLLGSCASRTATTWTPELVTATQQTFQLPGAWRFAARSGSDFGSTCDFLFEQDGTYRKSCRPPVEESGDWKQVGEWDGRTLRVRLSDRVDQLKKQPLDDIILTVVVERSDHQQITVDGARYERE